ncbi:phage major capsid protein, partial [Paraclostridium bifermentans]
MSKELRELLNQLDNKSKDLTNLLNKSDVTTEELKNASDEIDVLQAKIEVQKRKDNIENNFNEEGTALVNTINTGEGEIAYNGSLFTKAIADNLLRQKNQKGLNLTEQEMNAISENIDEDGGYAVPQDIQTKINTRLKDTTDLYNLV